jgi:DNA-binding helix-hairpin-helix protein with protein kinase domain
MPPIIDFYHPGTRRQQRPWFDYSHLHLTARNIAAAVHALHTRGYVIGDVNESNILVADNALVTVVDTDSFQVRALHNGVVYRCSVGKPEFTPPELQGLNFASVDRVPEHDLFGLAVLIFQLLMEGIHPFAGRFQGSGDPPPYEARIAAGHFPYSQRSVPYAPSATAPPFDVLHPTVQQLFIRCFDDGHTTPHARPDALTWRNTLDEARETLITCTRNTQHRYGRHLHACPWCVRTTLLDGRDPFPSQEAVQRREHLQPITRVRTPASPPQAPRPPLQQVPPPTISHPTPPPAPPTAIHPRASRPPRRFLAWGR